MKQKSIMFLSAFILYGLIFGFGIYYLENLTFKQALVRAIFFGFFMGLFEVFINPKIRKYFIKIKSK